MTVAVFVLPFNGKISVVEMEMKPSLWVLINRIVITLFFVAI